MKLVKIPTSLGLLKGKGTELAPDKIEEQLKDIWSNEIGVNNKFEIKELKLTLDLEKDNEIIENSYEDNSIFIGGDHSISFSLVKSFLKKHSNSGLIIFDAHPDVFQEFEFPTHQDWLNFLIEKNLIKPENIMLVGIRAYHPKETIYLKNKGVRFITMKNLFNNIENSCDSIMEFARNFNAFYLSIDIDVIDPAFAPGTSYIEPAGLTSRELIYFMQRLKLLKNLKAADIVEVNPTLDINNMTSKLAAKLIIELQ